MNKNRGEERRIVQPGTIASHLHLQQTSHQVSSSSPACNYNYPVTVAPTAIAAACPCQRLCIYLAVSRYLKNQLQAEVDVMKHET